MSANSSGSRSDTESRVWLSIAAFLSMRAPKTQETYSGIIREWCRFLGAASGTATGARKLVGAKDIHAIGFRAWLENQPGERPRLRSSQISSSKALATYKRTNQKKDGLHDSLSNATIAKKFAALRRIYRMLLGAKVGIEENPFDSDRVPAPPKDSGRKRPTEMLDFKLVRKVIDAPNIKVPKGIRDRAILAILFGGGLRRSEIVSLRVCDVRQTTGGTTFLYLRSTKAKKDAEQAIPRWAAKALKDWLNIRRQQKAIDADFLFISYIGRSGNTETSNPISSSGVYKLFRLYCKQVGAGQFITPHSARATAITKLLNDGVPHRKVQEFSRHSSIQMVEAYDKRRISVDENPANDLDYDEGN